ncbi:MAG TPA: ATP-binding protein, partial [Thermoanaerobaculia bacterium]|nr:ATP-binding protein [Thermoanaerobaculia bacterium]
MTSRPIASVALHYDFDLVAARRRARAIAALLGFDAQEQTRIATVVSELARNALRYAGGGRVDFSLDRGDVQSLGICVADRGPGIENVDEILSGRYRSKSGMGMGLIGARRLMDDFSMRSRAGEGTTVIVRKNLPRSAHEYRDGEVEALAAELASQRPADPVEEIQQQNAELLKALADLNERQLELERLNQELEDTNRGVLALYAELDEKAESVRRSDDLKTRFLADMSHEFRTPVNSILALSRLIEETPLTDEARRQVLLIRRSADELAGFINDLLDLAKIEAGKVEVRPAELDIANLFSALRGMLRPLLVNRSLSLVFDETDGLPLMFTDEGKLSQILRNFISNALKFTESGEIRVSAEVSGSGDAIVFSVADTGIGIAPEDQERIFDEFAQVDTPLHRSAKGSGLGLPLTRRLAKLLGGFVTVESEPGVGSTFRVELPIGAGGAATMRGMSDGSAVRAPRAIRILIVDDDETARYTLRSFATRPGTEIMEAENGTEGIAKALAELPDLVMLDMMMPGIGGHEVLQRLKSDPATSAIPVVMVTSRFVNDQERTQVLSRAAGVIYKGDLSREVV